MKIKKLSKCKCGCGKRVTSINNRYILGHNTKKSSSNNDAGKFKHKNTHGKGRPQGSRNSVSIIAENLFIEESGAIARQAVEMALNGHVQMIKLILERVLPIKKSNPIKLKGMPVVNSLETAHQATAHILKAVTSGKISPLDAEILSRIAEKHIKSLQLGDLEQRLQQLEDLLPQ